MSAANKEVPILFSEGKCLQKLKVNIRDAFELMMEEAEVFATHAEVHTKVLEVKV